MNKFYLPLTKFLHITTIIIISLNHQSSFGQQLSEVMFAPTQSHSEFIELFNNSDTTVNLYGCKIKYHSSGADQIISLDTNYRLPPNQYAVILEADYDFVNGIYNEILPTSILQIMKKGIQMNVLK